MKQTVCGTIAKEWMNSEDKIDARMLIEDFGYGTCGRVEPIAAGFPPETSAHDAQKGPATLRLLAWTRHFSDANHDDQTVLWSRTAM